MTETIAKTTRESSVRWALAATFFAGAACVLAAVLILKSSPSVPSWAMSAPEVLRAAGVDSNDQFAIGTALIDDDVEGLFMLDKLTGDLSCFVVYPRTGKLGGVYKSNVLGPLGVAKDKRPALLMTTGVINFAGGVGAGGIKPSKCIVYVTDANTGNTGAFYLNWNATLAAKPAPQSGTLTLLDFWKGKTVVLPPGVGGASKP